MEQEEFRDIIRKIPKNYAAFELIAIPEWAQTLGFDGQIGDLYLNVNGPHLYHSLKNCRTGKLTGGLDECIEFRGYVSYPSKEEK